MLTSSTLPEPVSQLQANFTLLDKASGPRVEISCQVSSGSPPITYSLVGKDGSVHTQQRPNYGQPANFSFALTNTSNWLQCQAENDISVQSSPFKMVPPGEKSPWFPEGQLALWVWQWETEELRLATVRSGEGRCEAAMPLRPCLRAASSATPLPHRTAAPGGYCGADWEPHLHCSCHLLVARPGLVDQVGNGCKVWGHSEDGGWRMDHQEPGWRQRVVGLWDRAAARQRAMWLMRDLQISRRAYWVPRAC